MNKRQDRTVKVITLEKGERKVREIIIPNRNNICHYCSHCTYVWGQKCKAGHIQTKLKYVCPGMSKKTGR